MKNFDGSGARRRVLFQIPDLHTVTICGACQSTIEADNEYLNRVKVCRKCLDLYSKIDSILDAAAIEKTRSAKLNLWGAKNS